VHAAGGRVRSPLASEAVATLRSRVKAKAARWGAFFGRADVALDMGTEAFRLAHVDRRSVIEIPARVTLDARGRIVAAGRRALWMEERLPENWRAVRPVEMSRLSHPAAARHLVRLLFAQTERRHLQKPHLWLPRPSGLTPMQRQILESFLREVPVHGRTWCDGPYAAAVGSGLDPEAEAGLLVLDLGAQRTSATILSFGRSVMEETWPEGGATWTDALRTVIEDDLRMRVPRPAVEMVKRDGGACVVTGQDRISGRVRECPLTREYVIDTLKPHMTRLLERLGAMLTRASPALRMDVQATGAVLVGNGALLPDLRERLQEGLGLPVRSAEDPGRALVRGLTRLARAAPPSRQIPAQSRPAEVDLGAELLPLEI
jgi:rod shape-determining protein MreB